MSSAKPNILWLYLEDVSPWFGCYGDKTVSTPHLDALAASGLLFERCYSTAPVCSPARTALVTGQLPTSLGLHSHRSSRTAVDPLPLPAGRRTLPELMQQAGYVTFNAGKDDYNFLYHRDHLYPGPFTSHFHWKEGPPVNWNELPRLEPFFGQIQLEGGKVRNSPDVQQLAPDPATVPLPPYYPDHPAFRRPIALHYAAIREMDRQVGEILRQLAQRGLAERTAVFLFADHGMDGLRYKQFCYEGGLHVPLIIRLPQGGAGQRRSELTSTLDIAATTLALAGVIQPDWFLGHDLIRSSAGHPYLIAARDRCDYTLDRIRAVRTERYRYIRNFHPERPWLQPQYRSNWPEFRIWKELAAQGSLPAAEAAFALPNRPDEELYDLENDPHQIRNLAQDSAHASVLKEHRTLLGRWMAQTKDRGVDGFTETDLLATLLRWGDDCVDPEYEPVRRRHAAFLAHQPEQRPWQRNDPASLRR